MKIVLITIVEFAYLVMLFSLKYFLTLLFKVDEKSFPIVCENLSGLIGCVFELIKITICNKYKFSPFLLRKSIMIHFLSFKLCG